MNWKLGIIGGSGLYALPGLEGAEWVTVETPFGAPSDAVLTGTLHGVPLAFLPRHGRGHRVPPGDLNARANIMALKILGCTDLLSVSAVGSLDADMAPGDFVVVDQFIDRTRGRPGSFFGPGLVAHVPLADPVCPRLSAMAAAAARAAGVRVHDAATYLAMEGPQFSTRAESRLYRQWGAQVIGMTAMPEARLAREAELPYALVAMVTDYDSWREADDVDIASILRVMAANADAARTMVAGLVQALPGVRAASPIDTVLDVALITDPAVRDAALVARLAPILRRVTGG
ncbi:5'-methylthioadenosine phosphorylase [Polymorphobacter multimanifer]|uniref:S-methyl-5'-thioadenosine phosphorylase n=1 Tax=Polymorphobacter multimanifer TaxID=1070431 RepID=A0A841L5M1_9SPHN|nr:S-methyl-5'-thioadenosine phosphorylase [Polymorphobacter multimanifer]MBB6226263.1 5'-methylthioadenosine phosphorylase [Polymorphobacter multimanifer]